jgi:hypothetical protein
MRPERLILLLDETGRQGKNAPSFPPCSIVSNGVLLGALRLKVARLPLADMAQLLVRLLRHFSLHRRLQWLRDNLPDRFTNLHHCLLALFFL